MYFNPFTTIIVRSNGVQSTYSGRDWAVISRESANTIQERSDRLADVEAQLAISQEKHKKATKHVEEHAHVMDELTIALEDRGTRLREQERINADLRRKLNEAHAELRKSGERVDALQKNNDTLYKVSYMLHVPVGDGSIIISEVRSILERLKEQKAEIAGHKEAQKVTFAALNEVRDIIGLQLGDNVWTEVRKLLSERDGLRDQVNRLDSVAHTRVAEKDEQINSLKAEIAQLRQIGAPFPPTVERLEQQVSHYKEALGDLSDAICGTRDAAGIDLVASIRDLYESNFERENQITRLLSEVDRADSSAQQAQKEIASLTKENERLNSLVDEAKTRLYDVYNCMSSGTTFKDGTALGTWLNGWRKAFEMTDSDIDAFRKQHGWPDDTWDPEVKGSVR